MDPSTYQPSRTSRRKDAVLRAAALVQVNEDRVEEADEEREHAPAHRFTPDPRPGALSVHLPPSPMVTPPKSGTDAPPFLPHATHSTEDRSSATGRRGVPHIYHDLSQVPDEPGFVRKKTGGVSQPFPEKLYAMLEAESEINSHIVSWCPHGRSFIVRKPKEFTEQIMPRYFRQSKLTSFQRQLNLYGFRRITQGRDGGAYYHEMFMRGRLSLCYRMKRQKVKGTGHKQPVDVDTEPNFYSMPPIQPMEGSADELDHPGVAAREFPQTPISPGIGSVPIAATLLRGIASGERSRGFNSAPFVPLPPPAADVSGGVESRRVMLQPSVPDTNRGPGTTQLKRSSFIWQEQQHPVGVVSGSTIAATKQTDAKDSVVEGKSGVSQSNASRAFPYPNTTRSV